MTAEESARVELRAELLRILEALRRLLASRRGGRAPADDALRALVIEEGEAEGIAAELAAHLAEPPRASPEYAAPLPSRCDAGSPESPLRRLQRVFRLDALDLDAVLLALAVEVDARFARLVAYLNDRVTQTRPTVGLVLAMRGADVSAFEFSRRPVVSRGLLQLEGEGPASLLSLRMAREFQARVAATEVEEPLPRQLSLERLLIREQDRTGLERWAAAGRVRPLVVSGAPGSGRGTAVEAASSAAGWRVVEMVWDAERADRAERLAAAVREAIWHEATLLVRIAGNARDPDVAGIWTALGDARLTVGFAVTPDLAETVCAASPVEPVVIRLDGLTIAQRAELWSRLLATEFTEPAVALAAEQTEELAARYDFPPATLARAVRHAAANRADADPVDFDALSRACRAVGSASMGSLAQRLAQPYTRADIVLPQNLLDELDLAAVWIRHNRRVFEDWGFGERMVLGRGLTALFAGESGTGKTMAAQVLARELGLDLFRVDLSRVVSKYIGETEKNLGHLFDDARASGAVLFFDEADALFGKRSEVKDAHDRYANLEIGYLLQRMEEHTGPTLLATNRAADLDKAFMRRFHFVLNFPMPGPSERRRIWEGMIPAGAAHDAGIDFEVLVRDFEVSGGEIRNSVLIAAFLAANEDVPIGLRHLKRGLRRELHKTGRVLDGAQIRILDGC